MLCSRCKKRQAVVFISTIQGNDKRDEGLCLICAKELGVPQVNDYLEKMGISDEDLEESYKMIFGDVDEESDTDSGADDDFTPGGAGTMMPFFKRFAANKDSQTESEKQDVKDDKKHNKKKEEKKRKFVCVDPHDIPVIAVVDSSMMSSMPKGLTASTGMDALTHAIEGYTTKGAWELTDMMHLKAIEVIGRSLRAACENDPKGREDMALGQYIAGMGFSNVGLGVVHGMAHPLGAFYDTPHGIANAVILPYVMEYNAPCTGDKFKYIAEAMGVDTTGMDQETYRKAAVDAVKKLSKDVGIPEKLHEIGVKEEDLPALAQSAFDDVCTGGNPRECTVESILGIYKTAF